ncbi:hypothetical protein Rsub_02167 [Raphidocelis subcapitata]|uniref:Uncharacterized protein n=1 Tax=Raphidocelis subcapitata TaxID=307507 RepID=A0A2V0NUP2_9CHLO|nr:hypothetical protein Rsub_02167 [Raphidocelis subcapitata]|eukprot:GBF89290.1 hypothetical protein Rsub_02167 [Raphidocelis subcapitata]
MRAPAAPPSPGGSAASPAFGGASGSAASRAASTLPWKMEPKLKPEPAGNATPQGVAEFDYDPSLECERIREAAAPRTPAAAALAAAVAAAKAAQGPDPDPWAVGCELRARHGYLVRLRRSMGPRQPKAFLRSLRHSFLVVRGVDGDQDPADYIVDLNFKDAFKTSKSRAWYEALMSSVPQDWVGPADALALVAGVAAAATRLLFRQLGLPLPPWREPRTVLSRWVSSEPDAFEDEQCPLLPAPEQGRATASMLLPYHGPFRKAVAAASALCGGGGGAGAGLGAAALLPGNGRSASASVRGAGGGAGGAGAVGALRAQLQLAAAQRLATREAGGVVPMVFPGIAPRGGGADGGGGNGGGGGAGAGPGGDVPQRVIVGWPKEEDGPHRLRRSSAPAWTGGGAPPPPPPGAASRGWAEGAGQAAAPATGQQQQADDEEEPQGQQGQQRTPQRAHPAAASAAIGIGLSRSSSAGALLGAAGRALSQSLPQSLSLHDGSLPWGMELGEGDGPPRQGAGRQQQQQQQEQRSRHHQQQQRQPRRHGPEDGGRDGEGDDGSPSAARAHGGDDFFDLEDGASEEAEGQQHAGHPAHGHGQPHAAAGEWQGHTPPALAAVVLPEAFRRFGSGGGGGGGGGGDGAADGAAAEGAPAAAAAGAAPGDGAAAEGDGAAEGAAKKDYKNLDQLLPKMRTVRLAG